MALNRIIATIAIVIAIAGNTFLAPAQAKNFTVGDDKGWTVGFDYANWTIGKEFYVGDALVFKYKTGAHTVFKANLSEYQSCSAPDNAVPLTSGNDKIVLTTPGNKWYFCTVAQHCTKGQKLKITVMPPMVMSPAPAPSNSSGSAAHRIAGSNGFQAMAAVVAAIIMLIIG